LVEERKGILEFSDLLSGLSNRDHNSNQTLESRQIPGEVRGTVRDKYTTLGE